MWAILSDFEAIFKRFWNVLGSLLEILKAKSGVRTAEEVLAHYVLTPGQKEVLERSNTWLEEVWEQVF